MHAGEQPILNLVGEKVALGPIRRDLLAMYQRWINDFQVLRTLGISGLRPMTAEGEVAWYERMAVSETDVTFTIYERSSLRPIGTGHSGERPSRGHADLRASSGATQAARMGRALSRVSTSAAAAGRA